MFNFEQLAELDGLISRDVGELLYSFAALVSADQAIVELGSYRGKSTCYLATGAALVNGAPVYAVDAWSEEVSAWRAAVLKALPSPAYEDFTAQLDKAGVRDGVRTGVPEAGLDRSEPLLRRPPLLAPDRTRPAPGQRRTCPATATPRNEAAA